MTALGRCLGWANVNGSPFEVGRALGLLGRDAVQRSVVTSELWAMATSAAKAALVARMAQTTQDLFPQIYEELKGLADGLGLPFDQVFAWNTRGDLLAGAGEGCTTVQVPGERPVIAHNEDGLPALRRDCFIAHCQPEAGPEFISFCYPGSLPGHTFAATAGGIVSTVNNIRLTGVRPEIPRMVLGRAVLSAADRAKAVELLRKAPVSGGFHLSLGQVGQSDIWSVTFGGGEVACIMQNGPNVHSNHALVPGAALSQQTVTASSRDRLARGRRLLDDGASPLSLLCDDRGDGLPIFRAAADDPDDENTIAQFVAEIGSGSIYWRVHEPGVAAPIFTGRLQVAGTGHAV